MTLRKVHCTVGVYGTPKCSTDTCPWLCTQMILYWTDNVWNNVPNEVMET